MRKRIVGQASIHKQSDSPRGWLDLEQIATVEATSEDPDFPIESVFHPSNGPGWRASGKEEQRIRIIFDQPLSIKRIRLRFVEAELERTQEFTISYSGELGGPPKEIVRQQWNFSLAGSTSEIEELQVNIDGVSVLELAIKPDLSRGDGLASLAEWRIGLSAASARRSQRAATLIFEPEPAG
jgi:hypothetical protein